MNKILIFLSFLIMSCSNNASRQEAASEARHERHDPVKTPGALQLNNGAKWKTDEATRKNVSAIVRLISDSNYTGEKNSVQLIGQFQTRIDTLVQQCRMKGPDHNALHMWLEKVLHDLMELKETDGDYQESFATLKKDVESFYVSFE